MNSIRYIPHKINTRFYACQLYSSKNWTVEQVIRKYHISKASLMRWMKRFDGTKESLIDKPKTPHSKHPNSHTEAELKSIRDLLRRNPNISTIELYGKLKRKYDYKRHPASLFRFLRKQGIRLEANQTTKKK
ncbi:MAG: hypothetical protein RR543_03825, partial [Erysipelotrichales bacterium]